MKLNAELTKRATCKINQQHWETSPFAGADRLRIECDDEQPPGERVTTIVHFAPGSKFSGHVPPNNIKNIQAAENCLALQKSGHLKQPVTYA